MSSEKDVIFKQRGLKLINYSAFTMPQFPHYRLGPDTTVSTMPIDPYTEFMLYPNPTNGIVHIEGISNEEIKVYDQVGSLVLTARGQQNIDLSNYENGIYFIRIQNDHGQILTNKIILLK